MAQSEEALAAARATFADGVADENAKRYEAALEEFRRVAAVRETANVRYRIASCLEALGRRADALASYEAVVRIGEGDATSADAVQEARERAAQLDRAVARLTISFSAPPPAGAEVRVDETLVDPKAVGDAIRLDPGPHSVTATAPAAASFRTAVTLQEGSRVSLTVDLQPFSGPEIRASGSPAPGTRSPPVAGYVALGIGGALAVGSVVSFVLRASNLATLQRDCMGTGNTLLCPQSRSGEVNGAHTAAQVEGPLGIGLGLGAAVAAGLGVWLIVTASPDGTQASPHQSFGLAPMLVSHGSGIVLTDSL
jgi:tetratricopeptide (TPR) repeat protein